MEIANHYQRLEEQVEQLLEQRRQILDYHPRRVILKELEKQYIGAERNDLEPTCPHCGHPFELKELLTTHWTNRAFAARLEAAQREEEQDGSNDCGYIQIPMGT